MKKNSKKLIWIDFDNSPHVLFFDPIIIKLKEKGVETLITARDFAQVIDLVNYFNIKYIKVGKHYGKNSIMKVIGIIIRALQLLPIVIKNRPDFAISHGSRAQFFAAKLLGIKVGVALDYEYIKMFPFLKSNIVFAPKMIFKEKITLKYDQIYQYNGIKEDVYVPGFKPSSEKIDVFSSEGKDVIITIRPPAVLAHYYSEKSKQLFEFLVSHLASLQGIKVIFVPRTASQSADIKNKWSNVFDEGKFIIPEVVINGLDLIYYSDLVISGGGTMIREAAALNVPAYSTFGSQIGAVDKYLEEKGRLVILHNQDDILNKIRITKRIRNNGTVDQSQNVLIEVTDRIFAAL